MAKQEGGVDIICSICLCGCTNPKLFKCFHVCCERCLVLLVVTEQGGGERFLTCPTCGEATPVPGGVAGLQSVFQDSKAPSAVGAAAGVRGSDSAEGRCCFGHYEELYCETCGELVCFQCVERSKHRDHDYALLTDAFKAYSKGISSLLEQMEKQMVTAKKMLTQLSSLCGELTDRQAAVKGEIRLAFRELREVLHVREAELVSQLDQMTEKRLKDLASQRDCIEATLADLNGCLNSIKASLGGKERDVLAGKTSTLQQVKKLLKDSDNLSPSTAPSIVFSTPTSADLTIACQYYGRLSSKASQPPRLPKCDMEMVIPAATVGPVNMKASADTTEAASLSRPSTPDQAFLDNLTSSVCIRLFVKNIPLNKKPMEQVRAMFSQFGKVIGAVPVQNRKNVVYVYMDPEGAKVAIDQLHGKAVVKHSKPLVVEFSQPSRKNRSQF